MVRLLPCALGVVMAWAVISAGGYILQAANAATAALGGAL